MNKRKFFFVLVALMLFILLATLVIAATLQHLGTTDNLGEKDAFTAFLMKGFSHIGDSIPLISICLLLIIIPKSRKAIALPVIITVITSSILYLTLRIIFSADPIKLQDFFVDSGYGFPSGHAMNNAALYTILILLIIRYLKAPSRYILLFLCLFLIISIGCSRIYLGYHGVWDVVGCWLIGSTLGAIMYLAFKTYLTKKEKQI